MAHTFYPFVENVGSLQSSGAADSTNMPYSDLPSQADTSFSISADNVGLEVKFPARIAVYDDAAAAPRVLVIEPADVHSYLEEITKEVTQRSHEQGGVIPFMVIREVVENLIHAYFIEPAISILPGGNTIRFSDQGPGIKEKDRAMEYGTTSATDAMKKYIRGVGSGLPYVQQYLLDKGGSLLIEDNMRRGTIVTISMGTSVSREDLMPAQDLYATVPTTAVNPTTTPATDASQPLQPKTTQSADKPNISDRGQLILAYLQQHENVGPTDLVAAYGRSVSTWSRELRALDERGLTFKQRGGQKRVLTEAAYRLLNNI